MLMMRSRLKPVAFCCLFVVLALMLSGQAFSQSHFEVDPHPVWEGWYYPAPPGPSTTPPAFIDSWTRLPKIFFPPNPRVTYDPNITSEGPAHEDPNANTMFETAAPGRFRNWQGPRRNGGIGENGWAPPDPIIAAGLNHVMVAINDDVRIYDKNGNETGSFDANTFFNTSDFLFDPKVAFDPWRNRWLVVFLRRNDTSRLAQWSIAISKTSTPTDNRSDWWQYHFNSDPTGDRWVDYPQVGFTNNAIYLSGYLIGWTGGLENYSMLMVLNKDQIYSGLGAGRWYWTDMESDGSNDTHLMPLQMWSYGGKDYVMSTKRSSTNKLTVRRITWTGSDWSQQWNNGPSSSPEVVTVPAYANAPNADQSGTLQSLETMDARLLSGTYYNGLAYASQTIAYNWASAGNRASVRVYRANVSGAASTVTSDTFGAQGWDYLYPAISHTNAGEAVVVYGRSNSSTPIEIRVTGWQPGAAEVEGGVQTKAGESGYQVLIDGRNRWGDYYGAALDPFDDRTVWIIGEYATSSTNWATWITETNYKEQTNITASNASGSIGQTITLNTTVRRNSDNAALNNVRVDFYVANTLVGTDYTNASGVASLSYAIPQSLGTGNKTILTEFVGNFDYHRSTDTATLTVSKANSNITLPNASGTIGQNAALTATLRRSTDSALLSGKIITFKIDGTAVGTAATNASGVATLNWTVAAGSLGDRTLTAEFAGDSLHNASSANATFHRRANTTTLAANVIGRKGESATLSARLTRTHDGALIVGRTVQFRINNLPVGSAVTDAAGIARLNYSISSSMNCGSYQILAIFSGDDPLNASSDTAILTVRLPGDVNGDNVVNDTDLLAVLFAFGTNDPASDLDGNGIVNDADLLIVLFNFGQSC
jgi:hypothetical protein